MRIDTQYTHIHISLIPETSIVSKPINPFKPSDDMKEGIVHGNSTILGLSLLYQGLYLPLEMPVRLGCISLAAHMEQCFNLKDPSSGKYSTVVILA